MGSSPLTRGKLAPPSGRGHHGGLIPAHAGKTTRGRGQSRSGSAHPRSHGENASLEAHNSEPTGSSPLTRGKLRHDAARAADIRLIPAHAGKTSQSRPQPCTHGAHPRSRGENSAVGSNACVAGGSSPLTRGKREAPLIVALLVWLIPAHAGKTISSAPASVLSRAHPRSRGENNGGFNWLANFPGSSPLTRGKPLNHGLKRLVDGLIPAHAGKTLVSSSCSTRAEAHPRSRGENPTDASRGSLLAGSSPLTRGKQLRGPTEVIHVGLIPAHAGKTDSGKRS